MAPPEEETNKENAVAKTTMPDEEQEVTKHEDQDATKSTALKEESLTRQHVWNLVFCLLAWGFTVASVTLGKRTIRE